MPGLEQIIVRTVLALLPEIIELARDGGTDAQIEARAKRLAIERAYEETRRAKRR